MKIAINPHFRSQKVEELERKLLSLVIGQDTAIKEIVELYQVYLVGMTSPNKPIGSMLMLGKTGSGKTKTVEATAEALFGTINAVVKIDCAEFQHSHEIAKLTGSPPGYLGHRETVPLLTQENIDKYHNDNIKLSLVLFDEIEKASDALWHLLLGVLDRATITLGDNKRVDMSKSLIVMTSNLGAREIDKESSGGIGFANKHNTDGGNNKISSIAIEAAKKRFSPEFMNRIDKVVVFNNLTGGDLEKILDLELKQVQTRIMSSQSHKIILSYTDEAKKFILESGTDEKYGARHLKRAIEQHVVHPLSNLLASDQVATGDLIEIDLDKATNRLSFSKDEGAGLVGENKQVYINLLEEILEKAKNI